MDRKRTAGGPWDQPAEPAGRHGQKKLEVYAQMYTSSGRCVPQWWGYAARVTCFTARYAFRPHGPSSRPIPLALKPPQALFGEIS